MNEIKNPEQKMDGHSIEKTPEQLRHMKESMSHIESRLDAGFDAEFIRNKKDIENKVGHFDKTIDEQKSKEELYEKRLDYGKEIQENKSKFSGENFKKENSYDAKASQEVRDLSSKANSELVPMGGDTSVKRETREPYTSQEISTLKAERDKIDAPTQDTIMQKVICVDTGNVNEDLKAYLNPVDRDTGKSKAADVYGFVSKAEDSAPFTCTPQDCYENLRLDYDNTKYTDPHQPVYVLRFNDGTNYDIPYDKNFAGTKEWKQPCTGNGFVGNEKSLIPEYEVRRENNQGAVITDGNIYRINPDGTEELVALYNKKYQKFKLCEGEVN